MRYVINFSIYLLFLFPSISFTQSRFDIRDSIFLDQFCHFAMEMPDGYLLCYGTPSEFTYPYTDNMFLLSKDGKEMEEIGFLSPGKHRIHYIAPWNNEGEYLLDMESPNETTGKFDRCIHIINQDFKIISIHCFETNEYSNGFAHNIIDGKYVFAYNIGEFLNFNSVLARYDGTDSFEFYHTPNQYMTYSTYISESIDTSRYLLYTTFGVVTVTKSVDLLRPLNLLGFVNHGSIKKLNNTHFVVFGISQRLIPNGPNEGLFNENVIKIVNDKEEVIASDSIGFLAESLEDKGFNYPAYVQSLDFNGEYIFSTANIQMAVPLFLATKPRKFQVIKHDTQLNRQWHVIFGGDVNTMVYGLFATEDGGCLVYGLRKTFGDTPLNYPFVMKLNADGIITSTSYEPEPEEPAVTIYGNPSSQLRLNIHETGNWNGRLSMHDLSGKLLNHSNVNSGFIEVNTDTLIPGIYIVQIADSSKKLVHSFKWIKG